MTNCWAESLGDCSDKITQEHIISGGMFPDQNLLVKGFDWCMDDFKEVSPNSLVKKVLCKHHNSLLSEVDQFGINAMTVFRQEVVIKKARSAMPQIRWTVKTFQINGSGLERWCLKTLLNVAAGGDRKIGTNDGAPGKPSAHLVRIVFGIEKFNPRAGLYGVAQVGKQHNLIDGFRLLPYVDIQNTLVGGLFAIHGYQFLLYLPESGLSESIEIPDFNGGPAYFAHTLYPLKRLTFTIGKYISHVFRFDYS